jgi:hypothetical protein
MCSVYWYRSHEKFVLYPTDIKFLLKRKNLISIIKDQFNKFSINFNTKTFKAFIALHEIAHYHQDEWKIILNHIKRKSTSFEDELTYRNNIIEKEADMWALNQLKSIKE